MNSTIDICAFGLGKMAKFLAMLAFGGLLTFPAHASIVPNGSSLTMILQNFYGCVDTTCTTTTTFQNGLTQTLTGGVQLTTLQVATGSNGEWDIWELSTPDGESIAGDVNADWSINMNYDLSKAVNFDGVVDQWTVGGVPVSPLSNFSEICCASATNPILPGEAYYDTGFKVPYAAGAFDATDWQQIFVDPYSLASDGGIPTSTADGFNFALHFTLQTPIPEPSTWAMMLLGFAGLGFLGYRQTGKGRAFAA